jgi:hypothetical protein
MTFNVAQKFFLGVAMLTPSELRSSIQANIASHTGSSRADLLFTQALFKAIADGSIGQNVKGVFGGTPITMNPLLSEARLAALGGLVGLVGQEVARLFDLYQAHVGEPVNELLRLVGYSGTSCPKQGDAEKIFFGLAFEDFQTG